MNNIQINVTLNERDMDKELSAEDLTLSASELTHLRNIMEARKILSGVWERYSKAICAKLGNESTKSITIVNRSWFTIDEAKVIEELGADGLARVKTKPVEQHYVSKL